MLIVLVWIIQPIFVQKIQMSITIHVVAKHEQLLKWQKIALARAFMRNKADILVLDEPTSAIDAQAEFDIFNHFRTLTENQMVFLISHRFSTVRMADKILVIEAGEVVEQGTHNELLQVDGRYAKLFSLQAAGYK